MRSTLPRRDKLPPPGPRTHTALRLAVAAIVGCFFGATGGAALGSLFGSGGASALAGGAAGALLVAAGVWLAGRVPSRAEPKLRRGVGLSDHILALQAALAAGPARFVGRIDAHRGRVTSVAVSADGRTAVSGGADGAVRVWDLASGFELHQLEGIGSRVEAVALSPSGKVAAGCGNEGGGGVVAFWDVESGQELFRFAAGAGLTSLAFTADGKRLLVGGADHLRVWDLVAAEWQAEVSVAGVVPGEAVLSVAASPDGRLALCGCRRSQDARLIELATGAQVGRFAGRRSWPWRAEVAGVAVSGDGSRLLTGARDGWVRVWGEAGEQAMAYGGHRRFGWGGVVAVAFLPGGEAALSAGDDGTVRLWGTTKGDERGRFAHGSRVCCLAVSRDGRVAVSGGKDGVLRTWELPS